MLFYFHKKCFRKSQLYQEFLVRQEEDKGLFSKMKYLLIFFLLEFTPCKAELPLQGKELQEKEGQKD